MSQRQSPPKPSRQATPSYAPLRPYEEKGGVPLRTKDLRRIIRRILSEQGRIEARSERVSGRRLQIFLSFLSVPALIMALLWIAYISPQNYSPLMQPNNASLGIAVKSPRYAAVGDESSIDIIVINNGTVPINGTVTLVFSGNAAWPLPDETTAVKVENLGVGERRSKRIKFTIAKSPTLGDPEAIDVQVRTALIDPNQGPLSPAVQNTPNLTPIRIGPIPYLKSFFLYIVSGNFLVGLGAFLWAKFKRRILRDEEKD